MTWRPFDPSLDAVRRANRWRSFALALSDCAEVERWALHPEAENPPMLAPPDAEIENGRVVGCKSRQPERMRRAREMAGLSLRQAAGWLHVPGPVWLERVEDGSIPPPCSLIRDMSTVYGVTTEWLSGADPVIPAETAQVLRDADISTDDRDSITELIGAINGGEG